MKIILTCIVVFIVIAALLLFFREYYVRRKTRKLASQKYRIFESILGKLALKDSISSDEVMALARNPSTRYALFGILKEYDREDLFPREYLTFEKTAESFLVNWLEFPTELGIAPTEINILARISLEEEEEALEYYVFRFRTTPPHHAARFGWMMGVVGPYSKNSLPYDVPKRIFSRFKVVGTVSAEEEVSWVHENINR